MVFLFYMVHVCMCVSAMASQHTTQADPSQALEFIEEVCTVLSCTDIDEFNHINKTSETIARIQALQTQREDCIKAKIEGTTFKSI